MADGQPRPLVSTLNIPTGTVTAAAAIVPAGMGGSIDVFVTDTGDLVIDTNGYFAPAGVGGLSLYNVAPCRVFDSRLPAPEPALIGVTDVHIASNACRVPALAEAFVLTATAIPVRSLGFLSLWPQGQSSPVSTLNAIDGALTSNTAIVPTTNGSISIFSTDPTHVLLDISGYFAQ
jgi:hypothetical protein